METRVYPAESRERRLNLSAPLRPRYTVRRFGIERCQLRIAAEPRPAVGTEDRARLTHIDVDVRVVLPGDTPMHSNSLTPMQISGTPRSFLNLPLSDIGSARCDWREVWTVCRPGEGSD